jgi:hypothetical protein
MKKITWVFVALIYCFLNSNLLFAAPDTWTHKADFGWTGTEEMGTARVDTIGFSIGSKGYLGMGYDGSTYYKDFWEYNPGTDTWTQKADFGDTGDPAETGRRAAVGFSIESKGYVGMGVDGTTRHKDFWEYNPAANTWTQKADFGGTGRHSAVGFSIGNKGYVGTGYDGTYTKDFWEYNPGTDAWTKKANLEAILGKGRASAVGFSIGKKGYLGLGMRQEFGTFTCQDFWEYDPVTDTWTIKASFDGGARYDAIGFSIGDKGFIGMGIFATDTATYYKDFWEYDPAADTWTQKADFGDTEDPAETGRRAGIGFSIGSMGYTGMGYDGSTYYKDFWEYDSGIANIPDPFTFTDQTNVALSTQIASNEITVTGISVAAFISITGGEYSINGGDYTSEDSTVSNGNTVIVRQTSSADYSTKTDATLYIGGISDTFSLTTQAAPPEQFIFIDQTDVDLNTIITSNTITVSGIASETPISITGGAYSINGGDYTSEDGMVNNGDTVTLQLLSPGSYATTTGATLTIGGVSDTFSVTTLNESGTNQLCFIATAAFGSPLAGQVEILRQFRDKYLLTNTPGRKFVSWYYRNGPVAANFIKDKPLVKAFVRIALYPLIGFSYVLISGYLPFVMVVLILSTLLFFRFRPGKSRAT